MSTRPIEHDEAVALGLDLELRHCRCRDDRIAALEAENERLRTTLRETQEQAHATIGLLKDRLAGRETLEAALAERDKENGDLKALFRRWVGPTVDGPCEINAAGSTCTRHQERLPCFTGQVRAALGEAAG